MRMRSRPALAVLVAVPAAILAAIPFLGRFSGTLDAVASLLPLAVPGAVAALAVGVLARCRVAIGLAGLALVASGALIASEAIGAPPDARPGQAPHLVIVTHNLGFANADPEATIAALAATDADILLLQEANGTVAPFLPRLNEAFPYRGGCARECDLRIFSRLPIDRIRWRFRDARGAPFGPDLFWTHARLPGGQSFTIATVHARWPLPAGPQRSFRAQLVQAAARIDRNALIIAGDFNLTPWGDGMADLDRGLAPMRRRTRALFSFPARLGSKRWPVPLLPIDHLFAGPDWSTISVGRLPATGSDHYPVRIELGWTPPSLGNREQRSQR